MKTVQDRNSREHAESRRAPAGGERGAFVRSRARPAVRATGFRGTRSTVPEPLRNDVRPAARSVNTSEDQTSVHTVDVPARPLQPLPPQPLWWCDSANP